MTAVARADAGWPGSLPHARFRRMGLASRLAVLTAVLALALVLGATEAALRWSARSRLEDRRRESVELAATWEHYIETVAPHGTTGELVQVLEGWPGQHLSVSTAAVFTGSPAALHLAASSDSAVLFAPAPKVSAAFGQPEPIVWYDQAHGPAWHVARSVGTPAFGVLEVAVSTATLADWARLERARAMMLAFAAALLVSAGVYLLTRRWVARPLGALGEAMASAHGGVVHSEPAPVVGPEEFRSIARRYNELRLALTSRQRESESRAALASLEERARHLDRLALMEEAASGFAHEIGTPLNTVSGHLQLLRDDLQREESTGTERVQLLLGQVDRLAGIVRARLVRGAWPDPRYQLIDLGALASRMLQFLEPVITRHDIRAELRADHHSPVMAWCDPALVEQILLNLLKNAIEAVGERGAIALRTQASGEVAWIEVSDSGPGIAHAMREQLFNPFVSTKGGNGTGLGLAVSRRLARTLGGDLEHVPAPLGTIWRLTLKGTAPR